MGRTIPMDTAGELSPIAIAYLGIGIIWVKTLLKKVDLTLPFCVKIFISFCVEIYAFTGLFYFEFANTLMNKT